MLFSMNLPADRSPLRYPGGKSRTRKTVTQMFHRLGIRELVSPFLGGGSIELFAAAQGIRVCAGDINPHLVNFWHTLQAHPCKLAGTVQAICDEIGFDTTSTVQREPVVEQLRDMARRVLKEETALRRAACFYIRNRTCYAGIMFKYNKHGGFDQTLANSTPRPFITEQMLLTLGAFTSPVQVADACDYRDLLTQHAGMPVYADPPYYGNQQTSIFYGPNGEFQRDFCHEALHQHLTERNTPWVLSYDNHAYIRGLYEDFSIYPARWAYGRPRKYDEITEILITSQPL